MRFPGRTLHLFENGRRLGALTRTPSGLALRYDSDWLAWEGATPVSLSLPLDPAGHRGEPVFRFLDNLLPDSEGMRARLAARVDAPDTHPFTLLAHLGRCSAGALTFVPEGGGSRPTGRRPGDADFGCRGGAARFRAGPASPRSRPALAYLARGCAAQDGPALLGRRVAAPARIHADDPHPEAPDRLADGGGLQPQR